MSESDAPKVSIDIGPVYHPDDPAYIERWHQARGDVKGENGSWTDAATGKAVNPADFPLPKVAKPAKKAPAKKAAPKKKR